MNIRLRALGLWSALGAAALGCALNAPAPETDEDVESSQSAIMWATSSGGTKAGEPVNQRGNPDSALFALSTVALLSRPRQVPAPAGGTQTISDACTGVILSATQVLTAAHCLPDATTVVGLYGVTGNTPEASVPIQVVNGKATVVAPGPATAPVTCTDPNAGTPSAGTGFPWKSCFNGSVFADIAILTTNAPMFTNAGERLAVPLGAVGQYAQNISNTSWEVGTGLMNGAANPAPAVKMTWAPTVLLPLGTVLGSFDNKDQVGELGDSGGPVYQRTGPLGSASLIVVGIESATQTVGNPVTGHKYNTFTNVLYPDNYNWIQGVLAAMPPTPTPTPTPTPAPIRPPLVAPHIDLPTQGDPQSSGGEAPPLQL